MYRQYLEWKGFRVIEASDGLQAIERAAALMPTVIVTDLALPRLSGWEAVRRLKADSGTKHIPVLALSAHAFLDDGDASAGGRLRCLPRQALLAGRRRAGDQIPPEATAGGPSARSARRRSTSIPGRGAGQARPSTPGAPDA